MSNIAEYLLSEVAKAREILDGIDEQVRAYDESGNWSPPQMSLNQGQIIDSIIDIVCRRTGFTRAELVTKGKYASLADARRIAIWIAWSTTQASYSELAAIFGYRDHSATSQALRFVKDLSKREPRFRDLAVELHREASAALKLQTIRRLEFIR